MARHGNRNGRSRKQSATLAYAGNGAARKPASPKATTAAAITMPRPAPLPSPQAAPPAVAVERPLEQVGPRTRQGRDWLWLGPAIFGSLVGLYFILRYGGFWTETDTSAFTEWIGAMAASGRLTPPDGNIYPNGFTYQALST